jgi:hypothetical protein
MKLSAISGVKGVYSDEDIAKVVALALQARKTWQGGSGSKAVAEAKATTAPRKRAARRPAAV